MNFSVAIMSSTMYDYDPLLHEQVHSYSDTIVSPIFNGLLDPGVN
jgi:hypothetical protein